MKSVRFGGADTVAQRDSPNVHSSSATTEPTLNDLIALNEAHADDIATLKVQYSDLTEKAEASKDKLKQLSRRAKKIESKIESSKNAQIQTLAVFVGLFTFISIEFQLFNQAESSYILPLSLGIGGMLIAFVTALCVIMRGQKDRGLFTILSMFGIILSLYSVNLYHEARSQVEKTSNNNVSKICKDIKDKIANNTLKNEQDEVTKLKASYETLQCE